MRRDKAPQVLGLLGEETGRVCFSDLAANLIEMDMTVD
jgi:hypothetical protein